MRATGVLCVLAGALLIGGMTVAAGDEPQVPPLPKPQMDGGKPLMQALKERKSTREFSSEKIPAQVLSNLLWAADGINRPDSGRRTAPSALNWQEVEVYVVTPDSVFLYDAKDHRLQPVLLGQDIRALTGTQPYVKDAPLNFVYVADHAKMVKTADADKGALAAADTGFIAQNVYLFCASEGLATTVRGSIDKGPLALAMKLRPDQKIVLAQAVGYPKK